jgi:transcriptional regulator with XRE-family HTH domain
METIDFSNWLVVQLEQREMTQADLAKKSGITPAQISRIISGRRGIGEDAAQKIAKAFKLPPEDVYRAAGILPPEPTQDSTLYRINHLYHTLKDQSNKSRALEFLEFLSQQEEKNDRKGKGTK